LDVKVEIGEAIYKPAEIKHRDWGDFYVIPIDGNGYVWVSLHPKDRNRLIVRVRDQAPRIPKRILVNGIEITKRQQTIQLDKPYTPATDTLDLKHVNVEEAQLKW